MDNRLFHGERERERERVKEGKREREREREGNRATLLVHTYPKRSKRIQRFAERYGISIGQIGRCAKRVCDPVI